MKLFFSTTGFYYQDYLKDNKYGGYYWLSFVYSSYVGYIEGCFFQHNSIYSDSGFYCYIGVPIRSTYIN